MHSTILLNLLSALLLFCFHVSSQAAKTDLTSEQLMEQTSFIAILGGVPDTKLV
jgi:hypothetical protein